LVNKLLFWYLLILTAHRVYFQRYVISLSLYEEIGQYYKFSVIKNRTNDVETRNVSCFNPV